MKNLLNIKLYRYNKCMYRSRSIHTYAKRNEFRRKNENKTYECSEMFSHTNMCEFFIYSMYTIWSCKCYWVELYVPCTVGSYFIFFMVKQIFLPSFRETPFLLGLFVSSSKQNFHEKKINGSLGKICVNTVAYIVKTYNNFSAVAVVIHGALQSFFHLL